MIARPLMTADELKSLPKDTFIVTKTGAYPMKTVLRLFFKWGIVLDKEFVMPSLRKQWQIELNEKFDLPSVILEANADINPEDG